MHIDPARLLALYSDGKIDQSRNNADGNGWFVHLPDGTQVHTTDDIPDRWRKSVLQFSDTEARSDGQ